MSIAQPLATPHAATPTDAAPFPSSPNAPRNALPAPSLRRARRSDPTQLKLHRAHCAAARSQLHGLRGAVEVMDAFLSPRFFSTLVVLCVAGLGLGWWLA
jgi:hypothetical protein